MNSEGNTTKPTTVFDNPISDVFKGKKYLNLNEAAEYLGIKPRTLRYFATLKGEVNYSKIGHNYIFEIAELDNFFKKNQPQGEVI